MAVGYTIVGKVNPMDREAPKKYYANAKSKGELTFKKLSKEIAEGSTTVSDSDVLAVLNDLTKILRRHLENGEVVRFGDFGTFQIGISSEGAESESKFHHSMIKKSRVLFRPGSDLKEMLALLKFERIK